MNAPSAQADRQSRAAKPVRLKCLIVDDDPVTLSVLAKTVGSCGHEVVAFDNAEAAWQACRKEFHPLVMLDWLMPGMDGLALCRALRTLPCGDQMVILVVTANDRPDHLQAVLAAGADDFVAKPINFELVRVRLAIAEKQARDRRERHLALEGRREAADEVARTLAQIETAKKEWEATADSLPQVICLLDADGRVMRANMTVEQWRLRNLREVKGVPLHELLHPRCSDPACYLKALWRRSRDRLARGGSFEVEADDKVLGRFLSFQFSPVPSREEGGNVNPGIFAVATVDDITARKNVEIELARAREREIEIGSRIQQSLLFGQPPRDMNGLTMAAMAVPSQRIDGDFYSFFRHSDTVLDVILGDVMGKGVPAALIGAATVNSLFRTIGQLSAASTGAALPEPETIVTRVNAALADRLGELDSFVTLCYARFDLEHNKVVIVDCGHPKTLHLRRASGQCVVHEGGNLPLGFSEKEMYRQVEAAVAPGDAFLFVSDGVIEAQNTAGELFGAGRLQECFREIGRNRPNEIIRSLRAAVRDFTGTEATQDDLTCIAVALVNSGDGGGGGAASCSELELTSDLCQLENVRSFVRRCVRDAGSRPQAPPVDEDLQWQLELAVNEAAANVIKHAYGGRQGEWFSVAADITADRIGFTLKHRGEGLNPDSAKDPAFDGTRDNGFGLFIIENYMDRIEHFKDAAGNQCMRLVKNVGKNPVENKNA